jgi:hypothetical protein
MQWAVLGSKRPANRHLISFWDRTGTAPRCMYRTCRSFSLTTAAAHSLRVAKGLSRLGWGE